MTAPPVTTVRDIWLLCPDSTTVATSTSSSSGFDMRQIIFAGHPAASAVASPGEEGIHGLAAGLLAGHGGGAGKAVDHGPAEVSGAVVQVGVRLRGGSGLSSLPAVSRSPAPGPSTRRRQPFLLCPRHRSRSIALLSNARKSVFVGVDIALGVWLRFSRSPERQQGPADTNCQAEQYKQYPQVQFAGRCGGGVPKPERLQDGDGTGDRTGWPAVIRGRRQQDRGRRGGSTGKCSSRYPAVKSVSSTSVKASAADARTGRFGSGVPSQSRRRTGDGAGCRRAALPQAAQQYAPPAVPAVPVVRSTSSTHRQ